VLLPVQDYDEYFPPVAGFSILFIIFGMSTGYVLLNRTNALTRIWLHPLFLMLYALLGIGFFIESLHPHSSYGEIFRIGQMAAGAVIVACLCRDRRALRVSIFGFLIAGVWVSIFVFLTSYGVLQESTATNFSEASSLRGEVFGEMPRGTNPNALSLFCALGAVVALAFALTASIPYRRYLLMGVSLFCLLAAFLPLSRGGVAIAIVSSATVMFASEAKWGKIILATSAIAVIVMMWVPDAVWSRMTFTTQSYEDQQEGRTRVYTAAIKHLPNYWTTGVGAGHFWEDWGETHGFSAYEDARAAGAHNCFLQVTIYWGLLGLLAFVGVLWQAYRCLPTCRGGDALTLALLGIAVSLLLLTQLGHTLYSKEFSLALGLIVGAHRWIWPARTLLLKNDIFVHQGRKAQ
jgi:hypothetical protein